VVGAFTNDFKPNLIIFYDDLDWSFGKEYEKLGFKKEYIVEPSPIHLKGNVEVNVADANSLTIYGSGYVKFVKDNNF